MAPLIQIKRSGRIALLIAAARAVRTRLKQGMERWHGWVTQVRNGCHVDELAPP
jgi:hypothetical protein